MYPLPGFPSDNILYNSSPVSKPGNWYNPQISLGFCQFYLLSGVCSYSSSCMYFLSCMGGFVLRVTISLPSLFVEFIHAPLYTTSSLLLPWRGSCCVPSSICLYLFPNSWHTSASTSYLQTVLRWRVSLTCPCGFVSLRQELGCWGVCLLGSAKCLPKSTCQQAWY